MPRRHVGQVQRPWSWVKVEGHGGKLVETLFVCAQHVARTVSGVETAHAQRASPPRELACHMRSHSVTCHRAEVTFPPLP